MSFAQTFHMSYTIDYLSQGGYQSNSVTLTCVDSDSYQSRLELITLYSSVSFFLFSSLFFPHPVLETENRNNGNQGNPILWNRYGPRDFPRERVKGARIHD